ncbi:MAG: PEGA domain-containing protein [Planctomycetota bacterium]
MRWLLLLVLVVSTGCVERRMKLLSQPPGALVFVNGEEVGRTPVKVPFTWYGNYDVVLRKEGFATLDTTRWIVAPWWQWVGFDLIADVMPIRLTHTPELSFVLEPDAGAEDGLVERAEAYRDETLDE